MDIKINKIGSRVAEKNFSLSRPNGLMTKFDFIQFLTETKIKINGVEKKYIPGTCIIYEPDFPQFYSGSNEWLDHDWIEFECYDKSIFEQLRIPLNTPFNTKISKKISNQIQKMSEISKDETFFTQTELVAEFYNLIILISKNLHSKTTSAYSIANRELNAYLINARLEIYQNPCNINVKQIAKKNGFDTSHFIASYKKAFQVTVHEDLTKARLLYVKNALFIGEKPSNIAKNLGFSSVEYLYMWFKKLTGKTVNEFRK